MPAGESILALSVRASSLPKRHHPVLQNHNSHSYLGSLIFIECHIRISSIPKIAREGDFCNMKLFSLVPRNECASDTAADETGAYRFRGLTEWIGEFGLEEIRRDSK